MEGIKYEKPVMEIILLDDGIQTNECAHNDVVAPSCGNDDCYWYDDCREETGCGSDHCPMHNPLDPYL